MKELERAILGQLSIAMGIGDPESNEARKLVTMHRRWIGLNWGYEPQDESIRASPTAILADQRFVDYYDKPCGTGATAFLVRAINRRSRIDRGGFGYLNQNLNRLETYGY